jgi:hypothetical protein
MEAASQEEEREKRVPPGGCWYLAYSDCTDSWRDHLVGAAVPRNEVT